MFQRAMTDLRPTKLMKDKIFIKTNRIGFIPYINMQGPIVTPLPVTRQIAHAMVVAGVETYMVDPKTKKVTLLTIQNVYPGEGDPEPDEVPEEPEKKSVSGVVNQKPAKPVDLKGVSAVKPEKNKTDAQKEEKKSQNVADITDNTANQESTKTDKNDGKKSKHNKK